MATLDELLAQTEPNKTAIGGTSTNLDELLSRTQQDTGPVQERAYYPDSASSIQSRPLTEEEEVQQEWYSYLDSKPVKEKRSIIPQAIGGTAGALVLERAGSQAARSLPPQYKWLAFPLKAGAAVLGAYGGGASGRGYQQVFSDDIGTFREQHESGVQEALSELAGQGVGGLIGKALAGRFLRNKQIPGMAEASEELTEAGKRVAFDSKAAEGMPAGVVKGLQKGEAGLSTGQQTISKLTGFEEFLATTRVGGGTLRKQFELYNPVAYKQLTNDLVYQYWDEAGGRLNEGQLRDELQKVVRGELADFKSKFTARLLNDKEAMSTVAMKKLTRSSRNAVATAKRTETSNAYDLFKEVAADAGIADISKGRVVPMDDTMSTAAELKKEWLLREDAEKSKVLNILDSILKGANKKTIRNAEQTLSNLKGKARDLEAPGSRSISPKVMSVVNKVSEAADSDLKRTLDQFDSQIFTTLQDARQTAAKNINFEESDFVVKIHKIMDSAEPEKIVDHIFKSPESVTTGKEALGNAAVDEMAETWLHRTLNTAMGDSKSIGTAFESKLDKKGVETLDAMFGSKKVDDLYAVADMMKEQGSSFLETETAKAVSRLSNDNPSLAAKIIFQPENVRTLRMWKDKLGAKGYPKALAAWVENAAREPSMMKSLNKMGDNMLNEMFDADHLANIRRYARLGERMGQTKEGRVILAHMVDLSVLSSLVNPYRARYATGAAGAGLFTLGRILSKKKTAKWLVDGLVDDPHNLPVYAGKITAELLRQQRVATFQREQEIPPGRSRDAFIRYPQ